MLYFLFWMLKVTAVRMAERLTESFKLERPLSVFMFIGEPTLNGVAKVILKLESPAAAKVQRFS